MFHNQWSFYSSKKNDSSIASYLNNILLPTIVLVGGSSLNAAFTLEEVQAAIQAHAKWEHGLEAIKTNSNICQITVGEENHGISLFMDDVLLYIGIRKIYSSSSERYSPF